MGTRWHKFYRWLELGHAQFSSNCTNGNNSVAMHSTLSGKFGGLPRVSARCRVARDCDARRFDAVNEAACELSFAMHARARTSRLRFIGLACVELLAIAQELLP